MVLVDTSILIDYLRGTDSAAVGRFQQISDNNIPFGISPLTYLEVLQGTRTDKDSTTVKSYLETHRFFGLPDERGSYAAAARIYFRLPQEGHHHQQHRRLPDRPDRDRERPVPAAQ